MVFYQTILGVHVGAQTNSDSKYVAAVIGISEVLTERVISPILHPEIIFRFSKLGRQFKRHCQSIHRFTLKVIQEKKQVLRSKTSQPQEVTSEENNSQFKRRRKALMDLLLDVHLNNKEGFTDEDIKEEVNNFVFAGHDTTSMAMSWALYLIGLYPDVQRKVHQELSQIFGDDQERPVIVENLKEMQYLERVIKTPTDVSTYVIVHAGTLNVCEVQVSTSAGGYKIKRGTDCAVFTYWLHRNPEAFPNPERFDPDRFLLENCVLRNPFAYVPFSAGPRNCIGQRFAMMEIKVVISNILRHFHVESLETRDKIYPVLDIILRSSGPLKLKLTPHTPTV